MSLGSIPSVTRILAILLTLSGCASTPQHLNEQSNNDIKRVAIVSLVPESVNFDKIGIISYSNKYTEFDMGSRVTDSILYVSRERIAKVHPNWDIKSVGYDRAALLAKVESGFGFRSSFTKSVFTDLARDNNLDAIIVVRASADEKDNSLEENKGHDLREGLNVLLKTNNLDGNNRLVIRANLNVLILGKSGDVMAAGSVPAKLDHAESLEPDDYDVSEDMKHNLRPEVVDKVGEKVIVDLARRLNLCFDTLGFGSGSDPESQHVNIAPKPNVAIEPAEKSPVQIAPATNSFDQCFSRCRQYTDRSKEQCFDACNK